MNISRLPLIRYAVTALTGLVALVVALHLWDYYMREPWTRDGRVRADVVRVAPDVAGLVTGVHIRDNQRVARGDVMFTVDPERYRIALAQADASVSRAKAVLAQAQRDLSRARSLDARAIARERVEQEQAILEQAEADLALAVANRNMAQTNLDRTTIRAPVNGVVSNFDLQPGNYVAAGTAVAALVDSDSFYVVGYFEETKLPRIHKGDPVRIHIMGENRELRGHVESIAGGIDDRERNVSATMLANVNPTFSWVRLAQRVPVRVALDQESDPAHLIAGRTATVRILPQSRDR